MWVFLLSAVAAQSPAPDVAVLLTSRTGLDEPRALELLTLAARALGDEGCQTLGPVEARERLTKLSVGGSEECRGRPACLAKLGVALGVRAVMAIELGEVAPDLAMQLTLIASRDGEVLADDGYVLKSAEATTTLPQSIKPSAVSTRAALVRLPPMDAPLASSLVPPVGGAVTERPLRPPPKSVLVTGGLAAVAAGAAAYYAVSGAARRGWLDEHRLESGMNVSPLTLSQGKAIEAQANAQLTTALFCALGSAALGASSAYLWVRSQRAP